MNTPNCIAHPPKVWSVCFISCILCLPLQAEITISDVVIQPAITGLVSPEIIGNNAVTYATSSKPVLNGQLGRVQIKSDSKYLSVKARFYSEPMLPKGLTHNPNQTDEWYITGSGKCVIEVIGFDPGIQEASREILLGPPAPPDPPPQPPGPVPSPIPVDEFNNIGQRVATWSANLPQKNVVGALYHKYATRLRSDPTVGTINDAVALLNQDKVTSLGTDNVFWMEFMTKLNAELQSRWPMARGTLADFWDRVGVGLSVSISSFRKVPSMIVPFPTSTHPLFDTGAHHAY